MIVRDDEPESAVYDDAHDDFNDSELQHKRSQFKDRFKLDYSAIIDNLNEVYEDKCETASETTSRPTKTTDKKRGLSISSIEHKRQRRQDNITNLLEVSESDEEEGNCRPYLYLTSPVLINLVINDKLGDGYESCKSSNEDYGEKQKNQQVSTSRNAKKSDYIYFLLQILIFNN